MKKYRNAIALAIFIMTITLFSCQKDEQSIIKSENQCTKLNDNYLSGIDKRIPVIYYATWDEWGRSSKNCGSFGLCNYVDCWLCDNGESEKHSGVIEFDLETNEGFLTIELNRSESIQIDAIDHQLPFFVDEDIINEKSILRKGEYAFISSIGKYGGYQINIKIK